MNARGAGLPSKSPIAPNTLSQHASWFTQAPFPNVLRRTWLASHAQAVVGEAAKLASNPSVQDSFKMYAGALCDELAALVRQPLRPTAAAASELLQDCSALLDNELPKMAAALARLQPKDVCLSLNMCGGGVGGGAVAVRPALTLAQRVKV